MFVAPSKKIAVYDCQTRANLTALVEAIETMRAAPTDSNVEKFDALYGDGAAAIVLSRQ
jgi:hypothetical protein